ncbi:MAG: hypothetical protein ACJ8G2_07820 [Burkholderiales bacterium]|jgi:hypothetical protein
MSPIINCLLRISICLALSVQMSAVHAYLFEEGDRGMVQISPYVYHRVDNTDHNQYPRLFGLEYESAGHWLLGGVAFRNSYYQDSAFVYGGKRWFLDSTDQHFYVKLAVGLVYGYKEPYDDRLPVNHDGYGLGIAPTLGYQFKRANVQFVVLGVSAVALTLGYDLWN